MIWRVPQKNVNKKLKLARRKEETLAYRQHCKVPSLNDLLCEEALVNFSPSQANPEGNFGFFILFS